MINVTLYEYAAHVTGVYDGDSITVNVDLGFGIVRHGMKLRLHGIDTPELRGDERPQGIVARDAVRDRILGRDVLIRTHKDRTGKYGRYLADIFVDGVNVNQWLLDAGHAEPYGAV